MSNAVDHVDQIDRQRDQPLWLYNLGRLIILIMLITYLITSLDANLKSACENASKPANLTILAVLAGALKYITRKERTYAANAAKHY